MPIANLFLNHVTVTEDQLQCMAIDWAKALSINIRDVCLSYMQVDHQHGRQYKVLVNLYLPSIWDDAGQKNVQLSLDCLLKKHLKLETEDVFIITTIVQSGNVVSDGEVVNWR